MKRVTPFGHMAGWLASTGWQQLDAKSNRPGFFNVLWTRRISSGLQWADNVNENDFISCLQNMNSSQPYTSFMIWFIDFQRLKNSFHFQWFIILLLSICGIKQKGIKTADDQYLSKRKIQLESSKILLLVNGRRENWKLYEKIFSMGMYQSGVLLGETLWISIKSDSELLNLLG